MINRYSLADYQVAIDIPSIGDYAGSKFVIGGPGNDGQGSYLGEIKITRSVEAFTTEGDVTGSWVHNRNLNKTGTVELTIRQVADEIIKLILASNAYESAIENVGTYKYIKGIHISVGLPATYDGVATTFIECTDCMINKIPDQVFGENAATQTWVFTAGRIDFKPIDEGEPKFEEAGA